MTEINITLQNVVCSKIHNPWVFPRQVPIQMALTAFPFSIQVMVGTGMPVAVQRRVTKEPKVTLWDSGARRILAKTVRRAEVVSDAHIGNVLHKIPPSSHCHKVNTKCHVLTSKPFMLWSYISRHSGTCQAYSQLRSLSMLSTGLEYSSPRCSCGRFLVSSKSPLSDIVSESPSLTTWCNVSSSPLSPFHHPVLLSLQTLPLSEIIYFLSIVCLPLIDYEFKATRNLAFLIQYLEEYLAKSNNV